MKTGRYFCVFLSTVVLLIGAYMVHTSALSGGHYAEEGILAGALLASLALVGMSWSIKLHLGVKALERHMKGR